MFKTRKSSLRPLQVLTSEELESVAGGGKATTETQLFSMLSNAVSEVMKSFGSALQTAARAG